MIYHVNAITGDDRHPGSEARPWRTLQRAARAARPGDRVVVHRGNYRGTTRIAVAGTEWKVAEPDETILNGEWDGRDTRYAPAVLSIEAPRTVVAGDRVDVVDHRLRPGCFLASVAVPRAMTSDPSMIVYMLMLLPPRM